MKYRAVMSEMWRAQGGLRDLLVGSSCTTETTTTASCAGWLVRRERCLARSPLPVPGKAAPRGAAPTASGTHGVAWRRSGVRALAPPRPPTRTVSSFVPPPSRDSVVLLSAHPPLHAGSAASLLASIFSIPCRYPSHSIPLWLIPPPPLLSHTGNASSSLASLPHVLGIRYQPVLCCSGYRGATPAMRYHMHDTEEESNSSTKEKNQTTQQNSNKKMRLLHEQSQGRVVSAKQTRL
uniref:Uncharacterized protein n=1 Tax=Oryza glumipatula TaxID=40148 RepID=A0A0D9Y4X2_9ORYZ